MVYCNYSTSTSIQTRHWTFYTAHYQSREFGESDRVRTLHRSLVQQFVGWGRLDYRKELLQLQGEGTIVTL